MVCILAPRWLTRQLAELYHFLSRRLVQPELLIHQSLETAEFFVAGEQCRLPLISSMLCCAILLRGSIDKLWFDEIMSLSNRDENWLPPFYRDMKARSISWRVKSVTEKWNSKTIDFLGQFFFSRLKAMPQLALIHHGKLDLDLDLQHSYDYELFMHQYSKTSLMTPFHFLLTMRA